MNRRKFFGMTAHALALAGLPEILLPEKTIFLPPANGWHPHIIADGYMRETTLPEKTIFMPPANGVINFDEELVRYDAVGADFWGHESQFHVDMKADTPEVVRLELARRVISDQFQHDGLTALKIGEAREFRLALPRGIARGRYV